MGTLTAILFFSPTDSPLIKYNYWHTWSPRTEAIVNWCGVVLGCILSLILWSVWVVLRCELNTPVVRFDHSARCSVRPKRRAAHGPRYVQSQGRHGSLGNRNW